ncbi:MAG: exonuclease domain-containing protein [Rubrivivax sp.]
MKRFEPGRQRFVASALALGLCVLGVWLAALLALLASTLAPEARAAAVDSLLERMPLLVLALLGFGAAVAAGADVWWRRRIAPWARLAEQVRLRAETDTATAVEIAPGPPALRAMALAVDALVGQRSGLRADVAAEVARAGARIEQERARLAALMAELTHSVVVCTLDGRVLLYNQRARRQFQELSQAALTAGGAELLGLGRSIYAVFDRAHVAHALETVRLRLRRGDAEPAATFVTTTRGGRLLRAVLAPVRDGDALDGFVLLLDDITQQHERDLAQDRLLLTLIEGQRASLGSLQAAVELLDDPTLDGATRGRLLGVLRDEVRTIGRRLNDAGERSAATMKARWPMQDMRGADLVEAARRRIEAATGASSGTDGVDDALWLTVDSFALLQALVDLARRLVDEFALRALWLRLEAADGGRARLDLIWTGRAMSTETVLGWENEPMHDGDGGADGGDASAGAAPASLLSVRDVVQRHGGEFWFERDRVHQRAFFRWLLPCADQGSAAAGSSAPSPAPSRPEYYDFDLFDRGAPGGPLDERPLAELGFTVFDTETTGLDPTGGDEIIQIGAARIVNGRLLRQECFEQLVDPRRHVPAAGIAIHGIEPDRLVGQPTIAQVLPAFHAYARDTVLVAHNAAFDMRFLQLKEAALGLHFDQPVLDTLLLSALVHPNQASHRLESIAERFGIAVVGRHTALGDALVTAEVFLRLLPLLAALGIHTLAQAREASQRTYYARLRY